MEYREYLKRYDNYDKYVLFLLAMGMSITKVAELAQVTRETVYKTIRRNQQIVEDWPNAIREALSNVEENADEQTDDMATKVEGPNGSAG